MISSELWQKLGSFGKGGALSIAMAGAGFLFHVAVASDTMDKKLQDHDTKIAQLIDGQQKINGTLSNIAVTIARVEGKIDVQNQKIDDDRSASRNRH
jgi:peptidoglycan hydrolase CwlO-like protein